MYEPDEEHTSFITDRGLYCYKAMPFSLKNARATQRLVNEMFKDLIEKSMEVYVDNMLTKFKTVGDHKTSESDVQHYTKVRDKAQPPEVCLRGLVKQILGLYGKSTWDRS